MCGIAGHIVNNGDTPDYDGVVRASNLLTHRGPDGNGIQSYPSACLAHRRLSIIDIAHSPQPWISSNNRFCMVFNGEIYNYIELRRELEKLGYHFVSNGDTEVLLNMYIHYGANCLDKLNGMFAFAIWDNQNRCLFIARDRLGKKPLYYSLTKSGLAFSSELNSLREINRTQKTLDNRALHDYFAYQFILGERSIFSEIKKLPPAHYMTYTDGNHLIKRYWSLPHPQEPHLNFNNLKEELCTLIDDAVSIRLRSNVPVGAFLSGGLDSAIIVSAMHKHGITANTYTIGFSQKSFDESDFARETAQFYNTIHHEKIISLENFEINQEILLHFGEPFADQSAIPTWHICKYTRELATVALSGDGGDELFAGYNRYRARQLLEFFNKLPKFIQQYISRIPAWKSDDGSYYGSSLIKKITLFLALNDRLKETPNDLIPQIFSASERRKLFSVDFAIKSHDSIKDFCLENIDAVTQMQLTDIQTYLAEDILTKVDRMSMSHSLEVRSPLLDYRVVEFACKLPLHYKIKHGSQKYILREAFRHRLPNQILTRRKQGFNIPITEWLRTFIKDKVEETIFSNNLPLFQRKYIQELWTQHQSRKNDNGLKIWTLYVFHLWYNKYLTH